MLINDDNDVNLMFDVLSETLQSIGVELYITMNFLTLWLIGVELYNGEDVQQENLEGYGGENLQGEYNILTQPPTTPCYKILKALEECGGSSS